MDDFFDRFLTSVKRKSKTEEDILNEHVKTYKVEVPKFVFHMSFGNIEHRSGHCLN